MENPLPNLECALGFPAQRIYRSSLGEEIVCDLEGAWHWGACGRLPIDLILKEFSDHLTCSGSADNQWGWCAARSLPDSSLSFDKKADRAAGQGWVKAENCVIELNSDERPVHVLKNYGPQILPFWNGFTSDHELEYIQIEASLVEIARFTPSDIQSAALYGFKAERASQVEVLSSTTGRGKLHTAPVICQLNRAAWFVDLPVSAEILVIQRLYDAFHGLQRARVFIDEEMVGMWHSPLQDRIHRWHKDSCHIRLRGSQKGRKVKVMLDPPAGAPLFSLSEIQVFVITL